MKYSCDIPIILLGKEWRGLTKWIKESPLKNRFLDRKDIDSLFLVDDSKEAAEIIKLAFKEYKKRKKKICLNINKYKVK